MENTVKSPLKPYVESKKLTQRYSLDTNGLSVKKYIIGLGISSLSKNNLGNSLMNDTILSDRKKFNKDFKGD